MKKWEDIVRDKLAEPLSELPESLSDEFRSRLDAARTAPEAKRSPLLWALVPAVAALVVAVLLLQRPAARDEGLQLLPQPAAPMAALTDTIEAADAPLDMAQEAIVARVRKPSTCAAAAAKPESAPAPVESLSERSESRSDPGAWQAAESGQAENAPEREEAGVAARSAEAPSSPFIPEKIQVKPVNIKVWPVVGAAAGGGLLAAVAVPLLGGSPGGDRIPEMESGNPGQPVDVVSGDPVHYFPLRLGLSVRAPLTVRLSLTSGLEYSLYSSRYTYTLSGTTTQQAHYLGVPLRLDWTFVSGKWLDVYAGGGLQADFCLRATRGGEAMEKDGFGLSLLAAGGLQLNLGKRTGLYIEPQISWTIPSESRVLQTYRSKNRFMFSLSGGVRINIGK